jgi:hypothetical protein
MRYLVQLTLKFLVRVHWKNFRRLAEVLCELTEYDRKEAKHE